MSKTTWPGLASALLLTGLATMPLAALTPAAAAPPIGLWQNPDGTIRVRTTPCGDALCGRIAAATPAALRISGCLIGGMLCKSQIWTRV